MLRHVVTSGGSIGPVTLRPSAMGDGFGCFTTREVEEDEVLFVVPARLQISTPTAFLDEVCGPSFASDDAEPMAAIAGFMAMSMLCESDTHAPYLSTLPISPDSHVVWWTEREMALLDGLSAYDEAMQIREGAEDAVATTLRNLPLREAVKSALEAPDATGAAERVDEEELDARLSQAVRGAYSCILSRAFGMPGDAEDREMVPILDMMQHGGKEHSVTYTDEVRDAVFEDATEEECVAILTTPNHPDLCCEVRARRRLSEGEELSTDYGAHPCFVFGSHYSFAISSDAEHREAERFVERREAERAAPSQLPESRPEAALAAVGSSAVRVLLGEALETALETAASPTAAPPASLGASAAPLVAPVAAPSLVGRGRSIALAAQRAAMYLEEPHAQHSWKATLKQLRRPRRRSQARAEPPADPFNALATLLAAAGASASEPLRFVVTSAMLEEALEDAKVGERPRSAGASLDAMLCCARLCVLDDDDGKEEAQGEAVDEAEAEAEVEAEAERRLGVTMARLTASRSGQISMANDRRAAALLSATASLQLAALDASAPEAAVVDVRPACLDLARSLRRSERFVLVRLRDSASALFAQAGEAI